MPCYKLHFSSDLPFNIRFILLIHRIYIYIQEDRKPNDPSSFIFASEDALSNPDKLMILIHGSGVVRAGQWARRYNTVNTKHIILSFN